MKLICGVFRMDGAPVPQSTVDRMCDAMQSPMRTARSEVWLRDSVGLGVLDFDDDSRGPLILRDKTEATVAGDIRLDNRTDLNRIVGLSASAPDIAVAAEVLAHGDIANLLGDFALASWSERERCLTLVRDALGVRPLVFHHEPGSHVVFASFASGVLASGMLERELDEVTAARESMGVYSLDQTLFRGVRNVRPGSTVSISVAGESQKVYWHPKRMPQRHQSPDEAAEDLRDLLQTAVACRVGTKGPVAAHLSGGLDSSAISVMASRHLERQGRVLLGYSFLAEPWPGVPTEDETPFVQAVLRQEPAIRWKAITSAQSSEWLREQMHVDRPLSRAEDAPENVVYADASANGASVLLSGWGGDEGITFNGRGALAAAFLRLRWGYLAAEMQAIRRTRGFGLRGILTGEVLRPMLSREWAARLWKWKDLLRNHQNHDASNFEALPGSFLQPELRSKLTAGPALRMAPDPTANQIALLSSPHLSHRNVSYAMMSARYGMAVSFPLLDRRVVEFALSVPGHWHVRQGWKRKLFRDAMRGILPPSIQRRHGKLAPIPRVLYEYSRDHEDIRLRVAELARHAAVRRIFDLDFLTKEAASIPSPEAAGGPNAMAGLPAFAQALAYALYLEQQF